jgi:hypothetical protein
MNSALRLPQRSHTYPKMPAPRNAPRNTSCKGSGHAQQDSDRKKGDLKCGRGVAGFAECSDG